MRGKSGSIALASIGFTLLATGPVPILCGQAQAREIRADMERYCKSRRMSYLGYQRKRKRHACGVYSSYGIDSFRLSKMVYIDLSDVCRRYYNTGRWRFRGDVVWCVLPDSTVLRLCNRRKETVTAAIGSYVGDPASRRRRLGAAGWVTTGWWVIRPGQCRTPGISPHYSGHIYVYGYSASTELAGNAARLCVRSGKAFKLGNSDTRPCGGGEYRRVGMYRFDVRSGTNVWNFR